MLSQRELTPIIEFHTQEDRELAFLQNASTFQSLAFSLGATWSDSINVVEIVRRRIVPQSTARCLTEFVQEIYVAVARQVDIGNRFVCLWTAKNKYVLSLVKRLVAKIDGADAEALAMDIWTVILRKLSDGAFQERSSAETNGWLKIQARGVISDWKDKNGRRLTKAHDPNFEHDLQVGLGAGAVAIEYEDKEAVSPDKDRKCPWGEDESLG